MMNEVNDAQEQPKVEIAVENFGPILKANIDLRPLTVFVGPSNTGKTYFATLVYALHGTFYDLLCSGLLCLFEPVRIRGILSKLLTGITEPFDEIMDILDKLNMKHRPFKLSDLPKEMHINVGIITKETDFIKEVLQNELKNCFDVNSISELIRFRENQCNETNILLRFGEREQEYWQMGMRFLSKEVTLESASSLDLKTSDDIILLPNEWSAYTEFGSPQMRFRINRINCPTRKNRYYLPAARSGIMQSHRIITSSLVKRITRVGLELFPEIPTLSSVIAEFLQQIILFEEDRSSEIQMNLFPGVEILKNQVNHIANTLETEILEGQVKVKPSSSGYPDFRYIPHDSNEEFRMSQSSSMVSELAPLVLYLRSLVQPGDTLIIEEPEAHLHPGAQADMAVILARLVRAGVRVIITTHSDWLLQEIGNLILEGVIDEETDEQSSWLRPEEVGAWHFQKDEPVKEIAFHPRKGFSPKDYQDVAEGLYNRSVNLQQKYEKQKGESEREST